MLHPGVVPFDTRLQGRSCLLRDRREVGVLNLDIGSALLEVADDLFIEFHVANFLLLIRYKSCSHFETVR